MDSRAKLERAVLRGQQASACLMFLDDFEEAQRDKMWKAAMSRDSLTVSMLSSCASFLSMFREYLTAAKNDGLIAERTLKEDQQNG